MDFFQTIFKTKKNSYLESKVVQKLQKLYAKYDTILRITKQSIN